MNHSEMFVLYVFSNEFMRKFVTTRVAVNGLGLKLILGQITDFNTWIVL